MFLKPDRSGLQPEQLPVPTGDASENPPKWECQCYSYSGHSETSQTWLHYQPKSGSEPPDPHNDADNSSTTSPTEVGPNTYRFSPLPNPLFDSDGESSGYVFRHKAEILGVGHDSFPVCLVF
ncbi:MAG: hypothetical protein V3V08_21420 [Nannocystaceae bacterium]